MAIDDDEERKDLTRIESLPEFLHDEDPEVDSKFDQFEKPLRQDLSGLTDVHELGEESPPPFTDDESSTIETSNIETSDEVPDFPTTDSEPNSEPDPEPEIVLNEETFSEEDSNLFLESTDNTENLLPEAENNIFSNEETEFETSESISSFNEQVEEIHEEPISLDTLDSNEPIESFESNEISEEALTEEVITEEVFSEEVMTEEISPIVKEDFEDVKKFAQNFSYGKVETEGNPPYSIIINHIKTIEDAEDITAILKEFQIIKDTNQNEYATAIKLGAVLIPQISEFVAIVLAHKFRRFDIELKVGLSDEIHLSKSKSTDTEMKGLLKKENLLQNKSENYNKNNKQTPVENIIISSTQNLEGYEIQQYIGTEYSSHIYEDDEFERIHFSQSEIESNLKKNHLNQEDVKLYKDYLANNEQVFQDLINKLKNSAHKKMANAIVGIQFQTNLITENNKSFYQLSCTGTLCYVTPSR